MADRLVGSNYITPDLVAKVTGRARWRNGPSATSTARSTAPTSSSMTGGGFGSKGGGAVSTAIPALLSKKANAPVMMRISREEESYIGRARTNMVGRAKVGFRKDGHILALDFFIVQDNGPYGPMGDHRSAGNAASLIYQPDAMRWRAVSVLTNTPPRTQQRSPGPMQANGIIEPVITKAAKQLGIDQVAIRHMNSPEGKALYGPPDPKGQRRHVTSAFVKQALDTSKGLPWTCLSVGSQTTHAMTRANHAGASDAKRKLQEIAAKDLGGSPNDYELGGERVFRKGNAGRGLTYAQAAKRAIELGGRYDGHELPADIHAVTKTAAGINAGLGLMGVAKDDYPRDGDTYSFVAGFAEVEVDVETGVVTLVDWLGVADVGSIVNPRSLMGQINGGCCLGIAHALYQKIVYDPHYGLSVARRFHHNKPLTILDVPLDMKAVALDIPDPETPVGARGVGEPPVGAGFGAVLNAISDAIGVDAFRRAPVTSDVVLMSLTHGKRMHEPLQSHIWRCREVQGGAGRCWKAERFSALAFIPAQPL